MKKNGFTLIELLAVIVILAIIALIATPMITNVINTAREGAAESSALGYVDAVEKQVLINQVTATDEFTLADGTDYTFDALDAKGVTIKGEVGVVILEMNGEGTVVRACVQANDKTVYYDGSKADVTDSSDECTYTDADPDTMVFVTPTV